MRRLYIALILLLAATHLMGCDNARFSKANEAITKAADLNNGQDNNGDDDGDDDDNDDDDDNNNNGGGSSDSKATHVTVAYEDLFPGSKDNDRDYNDFVVSYSIKEESKNGQIKKIVIEFDPKAHMAGYDHKFLVNLTGRRDINSKASDNVYTRPAFDTAGCVGAKLEHFDKSGKLISAKDVNAEKDIIVFENTSKLFGSCNEDTQVRARLTVYLDTSRVRAGNATRAQIDLDRYRVILLVRDTNSVLEPTTINPKHMTSAGEPYAVIVPGNYTRPNEGQKIDEVYPKVSKFREYLVQKNKNPSYAGSAEQLEWFKIIKAGVVKSCL